MILQLVFLVVLSNGPYVKSTRESIFTDRIINGRIVKVEEFPFYVFISFDVSTCGGALLSNDIVVTAAHCLKDKKVESIEIYTKFDDIGQEGPFYTAEWFKIHPNYTKLYFDIGVIKLRGNVRLGRAVNTIQLSDSRPEVGSTVRVVGYGYTFCERTDRGKGCKSAISSKLRTMLTRVQEYSGDVMIAENEEHSACFGDSGGPIIQNNTLVGVVSAVERYCEGFNYYVRTDVKSEIYSGFLSKYVNISRDLGNQTYENRQ